MKTLVCVKCSGTMEEGFTADYTQGAVVTSKWIEGQPERSVWTVTKTKGKRQVQIASFRCTECGYLESYAKPA